MLYHCDTCRFDLEKNPHGPCRLVQSDLAIDDSWVEDLPGDFLGLNTSRHYRNKANYMFNW